MTFLRVSPSILMHVALMLLVTTSMTRTGVIFGWRTLLLLLLLPRLPLRRQRVIPRLIPGLVTLILLLLPRASRPTEATLPRRVLPVVVLPGVFLPRLVLQRSVPLKVVPRLARGEVLQRSAHPKVAHLRAVHLRAVPLRLALLKGAPVGLALLAAVLVAGVLLGRYLPRSVPLRVFLRGMMAPWVVALLALECPRLALLGCVLLRALLLGVTLADIAVGEAAPAAVVVVGLLLPELVLR